MAQDTRQEHANSVVTYSFSVHRLLGVGYLDNMELDSEILVMPSPERKLDRMGAI